MLDAATQFAALLQRANQARTGAGLEALTSEGRLARAAQLHAEYLAANGFLSHGGADDSLPADRVAAQGYAWSQVGENVLARTQDDAAAAFTQWWDSAGHRDVLLGPQFTQTGFGRAYSARVECWYYVMLLARPG